MKLISLAVSALLLCASVSATAQSAPNPSDGQLDTESSIVCSGNYCVITTVVWMYVGT